MPQAEWSQEADDDLREIFRYITAQNHRAKVARKVVHEIREHCDKYANLIAGGHSIGTDRSDLRTGVRSFTHQRWVLLFRPLEETIRVLAVFDGSSVMLRVIALTSASRAKQIRSIRRA